MSNQELLARAAEAAACQTLAIGSSALIGTGVVSIAAAGVGFLPLSAGMAGLLAHNYLCGEMPVGSGNTVPSADGCIKVIGGVGQLQVAGTASNGEFYDASDTRLWPHNDKVLEITEAFYEPWNGEWRTVLRYNTTYGPQEHIQTGIDTEEKAAAVKSRIRPTSGTCDGTSSDPTPLPDEIYAPISYTDNVTNCTYNVTFQGFVQTVEGGPAHMVYQVEGATQQRADGGVIGGCNFPPTIYVDIDGGGGGPIIPVPTPVPPDGDDGLPWWVPALVGALGGAVANQILDSINDALAPKFEPATFTLTAPCDVDENGEPQYRTWEFLEGTFQERVNAHQVALMEIMQQHLDWKTPICREQKPQPEGTWISTRWISDGNSPGGERPLRKLFRYRSKSTLTDEQLREYWADFVWEAGPVCVIHKGAWWGTPQVWAATAEEGKRVIRRAGSEAGLDPDQTGEWLTRSSDSPRYGMPGTVRLEAPNGTRWVTRREGPSAVPS